jgi:hypothetical protein
MPYRLPGVTWPRSAGIFGRRAVRQRHANIAVRTTIGASVAQALTRREFYEGVESGAQHWPMSSPSHPMRSIDDA